MKRLSAFILLFAFAFSAYGQTGEERDAAGNGIRSDFYLEIIKGDVRDHSHVDKFGAANDVGTAWTIVSSSKTYQTPTTAQALELVSASADDSLGGSGINNLCVEGLGSGWQPLTQCKDTDGTSAVAFDSSMVRLFRIYGGSSGSYATTAGSSQAGIITVRGSGGGVTWGTLNTESSFGFGQSLIGAYTVPRGYTAYVSGYHVDVEGTKSPDVAFFKRCNADDAVTPYTGVMRLQALHRGADESFDVTHQIPLGPFPGPCDIGFFSKVPSGTADVSVQFEIVLVKE